MKPRWRKTVAVLEVVGGVCGTATVAYLLTQRPHAPREVGLAAVLIAAYLLALYAGVMLWRDTWAGRVASVLAQLIQLPKVLSPKLAFMVSYGLDFAPMAVSSPGPAGYGLVFDARVFSYPLLLVNAEWLPTGFGVSVVSLLSLRLLLRPAGVAAATAPEQGQPASPAPAAPDGQPEWVPSFGFILIGAVVLVVVAVCAGLPLLLR